MKEKNIKNSVFVISAILTIAIACWGMFGQERFLQTAGDLMTGLEENFSWLYLFAMLGFVLFALILAFGPWGKIRLGMDKEKPEYSTLSWFAMLFAAGMGVGLVFWGVAEPLSHYVTPMKGIEPMTLEAERFSIRSVIMHWGLHPWACYAVMGLGLAYFQFRKNKKALVSNIFLPMAGAKHVDGVFGRAIDIITTVITAIGVATSFGMGCLQVSAGLNLLFGVPDNMTTWIILIIIVCCIYTAGAVTGVSKGIKFLSNCNLFLCVFLMVLTFAVGPKMEILNDFICGVKDYIVNFFPDSVRISAQGDSSWIYAWRVFYWAWWVSWAPFVGVFIARISRGRTIREYVFGCMIVPTAVSAVWFALFGGAAIHVSGNFSLETLKAIVAKPETALFYIFQEYPLGAVISVLAILLVILFFITSADSAVFVLAMLTSRGDLNPPNSKKIFWSVLIAFLSFALILSGSITGIQNISIVIAFPYIIILLLICVCIVMAISRETKNK